MPRRRYADYFDEICKKRANASRDRAAAISVRLNTLRGVSSGQARSPQVVVKVVGWSKGAGAASRTARYIGRRDDERLGVPLETQDGREIGTTQELQAELDRWNLVSNADNRSRAWKEATAETRAGMSQNDALAKRQSVHMVFSLPASHAQHAAELKDAVRETLSDTMGAAGHRYLMAVHHHDGRAHVHVVAQVRGPADGRGRTHQLRIGREDIDVYRTKLASHLQALGVQVQATRRADRPELRAAIKAGAAPLHHQRASWIDQSGGWDALSTQDRDTARRAYDRWREDSSSNYTISQYVAYVQDRARENPPNWLETRAPRFYSAHGADLERRRAGEAPDRAEPKPSGWLARVKKTIGLKVKPTGPAPLRDPPEPSPGATPAQKRAHGAQKRLNALARDLYGEHAAAGAARFAALYRENPRAAVWAINNRPEAFGTVTGKATSKFTGRGFDPAAYPAAAPSGAPPPELRRRAAETADRRRRARDVAGLEQADRATAAALRAGLPLDIEAERVAKTLEKDRKPVNRTPTHDRTQPPTRPDQDHTHEKQTERKPDQTAERTPDQTTGRVSWEQKPPQVPKTNAPRPKRPRPDRDRTR